MKWLKLLVGIILFFGSVWVGAYSLQGSLGQWWGFPTFFTALVCFVIGCALILQTFAFDFDV